MYSVASRFTVAGVLLCLLGVGWHLQAAAQVQNASEELFRDLPRVGEDAEGVPPEQLPLPRELESETIISDESYLFQPPTRINRYDIWQFYAVGHYGRFRPRVIYSPYGSFYLYDGRPYPWVSTHQLDFKPRLIGP
jgi:hypothetical protein